MTASALRTRLRRDCAAVLVPSGQKIVLHEGSRVMVTQRLGDNITVQVAGGPLARVQGADADALGLDSPGNEEVVRKRGRLDIGQVIGVLRTVYDPEIPVNVVDLGLVYDCRCVTAAEGRCRVEIEMSMTAPGCGMADVLSQEARAKVMNLPGVAEVDIEIVWDPPWDSSRMSDEARLALGMLW